MREKITTGRQAREELTFAYKAAKALAASPGLFRYGTLDPGSLLAMRWDGTDTTAGSLRVVRIDPDFQPVVYDNLVKDMTPKHLRKPTQDT